MSKYLLLLVVLLYFSGCKKEQDNDFNKYLEKVGVENKIKKGIYIFFPLESCDGCITSVRKILERNRERNTKKINIIVVDYSKKNTSQFTKKLTKYRVYEDFYNYAINEELIDGSYPCIYEIDNYKIKRKTEIQIRNNFKQSKEIILSYFE